MEKEIDNLIELLDYESAPSYDIYGIDEDGNVYIWGRKFNYSCDEPFEYGWKILKY
jgi:hypothetical protein